MANERVSIAIHSGKLDYTPLIENLLKSILLCNHYPDVEIILIESAGISETREWFEKINFNDNFVNFDGTITDTKKHDGVSITKNLLFLTYPEDLPWYTCYQDATREALRASTGQYYAFIAEDNQFCVEGDVLGDYVKVIQHEGEDNTMVSLSTLPQYKHTKSNNHVGLIQALDDIDYFVTEYTKWDPNLLCSKKVYERLGPLTLSDPEDPHRSINYLSARARRIGLKRVFMSVSQNIWCAESNKSTNIEVIKSKTEKNPNFLLFSPQNYEELKASFREAISPEGVTKLPLSTDSFYGHCRNY